MYERIYELWSKRKPSNATDCPIFGLRCAEIICADDSFATFYSPRAGGVFRVDHKWLRARKFEGKYRGLDNAKLAYYIFQSWKDGIVVTLNHDFATTVHSLPRPNIEEQVLGLLSALELLGQRIAMGVPVRKSVWGLIQPEEDTNDIYRDVNYLMIAAIGGQDGSDLEYQVESASNSGLVERNQWNEFSCVRLTPDGQRALLEQQRTSPSGARAFVAMWFDESMDRFYNEGISPAIRDSGFDPYRIDVDKAFGEQITDKIFKEIRRSKFLVADFSHGPDGNRGSVYLEAGFAMGLGIPTIFCIRQGDSMAFDTKMYPHIVWKSADDLRRNLADRIGAQIGVGPRSATENSAAK